MKPSLPVTEKTTKTIILVGGDKGGVGKSTVARTLCEFFQKKQKGFLAFDGDDTNPTLTRFFSSAERLYTKSPKGFEPLLANLEGDKPAMQLVDLGAGTSIILNRFVEETGLIEIARENGAKIVFVFVLAPSADSINLLKILSEKHGAGISYVVARNNAVSGTWDLWENSKTKAKVLGELGGTEITIPILDAEAFALVDRKGLSWGAALQDKELGLVTKGYVSRWLQKVFAEFEKAKEL